MQNLINARGPIDDPSPVACASRSVILGRQTDGSLLSYKATSNLIASSKCQFSDSDIDPHLLSLLKVEICIYIYIYLLELCLALKWLSSLAMRMGM